MAEPLVRCMAAIPCVAAGVVRRAGGSASEARVSCPPAGWLVCSALLRAAAQGGWFSDRSMGELSRQRSAPTAQLTTGFRSSRTCPVAAAEQPPWGCSSLGGEMGRRFDRLLKDGWPTSGNDPSSSWHRQWVESAAAPGAGQRRSRLWPVELGPSICPGTAQRAVSPLPCQRSKLRG
jgi:hypothetical protein